MSVRVRLTLLFTLAATLASFAAGLLFARQLRLGLEGNLDGVLRARAQEVIGALGTRGGLPPSGDPLLRPAGTVAQLLGPDGSVADASDAVLATPLVDDATRARAARGPFITDARVSLPDPGGGARAQRVRLLAAPAGQGRLLILGAGRAGIDDAVRETSAALLALGVPGLGLAGLGAYLLAGAALRPVERMRSQAAAAGPGTRGGLAVPRTRDELARLAATLNDLLARQADALQQERDFVADAGHELRTPLAILAGELELASRPGRTPGELREAVAVAREETDRLVRLAEQLLVLARADSQALLAPLPVDLRTVVGAAVEAAQRTAAARGVRVCADGPATLPAVGDPDRLRQALDNILANALRYAPAGSEVTVRCGADGPHGVTLQVRDCGPGFPAALLPHAFDRFRRGDASRNRVDQEPHGGTGLGLAVVRGIAVAHGGTATAANDGGAVVTLRLPRG